MMSKLLKLNIFLSFLFLFVFINTSSSQTKTELVIGNIKYTSTKSYSLLRSAVENNSPIYISVPKSQRLKAIRALKNFSKVAFGNANLINSSLKKTKSDLIKINFLFDATRKLSTKKFTTKAGTLTPQQLIDLQKLFDVLKALPGFNNPGIIELFNLLINAISGVGTLPTGATGSTGSGGIPTATPTVTPTPTATPVQFFNSCSKSGYIEDKYNKKVFNLIDSSFTTKNCINIPCGNGTIGQPAGCRKPLWNRTYGRSAACCSGKATQVNHDYVGKGCGCSGRGNTGCIGLWECTK